MKQLFVKLLASAAFVLALMPMAGMAQNRRGINEREANQRARIRDGVQDGELTRREARRLSAQQARIRVNEAYARRSGGEFTPRERARIQRQLNQSNRRIYRQKHDGQVR
jgi:hypothetical protein